MGKLARVRIFPVVLAVLLIISLMATGCVSKPKGPKEIGNAPAGGQVNLNGAGSSFVFPLFSKMFAEYAKVHQDVRVNYNSVGSGAGIRQLLEKTVDFGASDAPMSDEELAKAGAPVLHIPVTLGAVAVVYNVPDVETGLKLDADVLARIFLGEIKQWNDPAIAALNPGVKLPNLAVAPAYRTDGSGTTYIFTDYLASANEAWKAAVGKGKSVKWPVGLGAKGNEGVTAQVQNTPGAIGYVELAYATQNNLKTVALKNQNGEFIQPSPEGVTAAAAGAIAQMPDDFRFSIVNAAGAGVYPIAGMTWALMYRDMADAAKGKALADLMWWVVHDGQQYAAALHYAPLPAEMVTRIEAALKTLTVGGQPAL